MPVNWTSQRPGAYVCSRPVLAATQPLLVGNAVHALPRLYLAPRISLLSIGSSFPLGGVRVFLLSASFLLPRHIPVFLVSGGPQTVVYFGQHLTFDRSSTSLSLVLFWSFRQLDARPLNLPWLFLMLLCSWWSKFIVTLVEGGFWLSSCQLLKLNCVFSMCLCFIANAWQQRILGEPWTSIIIGKKYGILSLFSLPTPSAAPRL